MNTSDWYVRAACAQTDPELWQPPKGSSGPEARRICLGCPSKYECLDDAMESELGRSVGNRTGIWGGLGPVERRALEPQWLADRGAA